MLRPLPPPLPPDDALLPALVRGLGGALVGVARYWGRRTCEAPGVGLLYLLLGPWAVSVAVTHLGVFLPIPRAIPGGGPLHVVAPTFGPETWRSGTLLLAVLVLLLLLGLLDRRVAAGARRRARAAAARRPAPPPDVLLLGLRVGRSWEPAENRFVHQPTPAGFVLTERELRTSVGICAPTGQGKSRGFLDEFLAWGERTGSHCCWIDPKGDDADPARFTHVFDLADPARSFAWDLYGALPPPRAAEALGEALFPLAAGADPAAEYFTELAKEAVRAIFVAHAAATNLRPEGGRPLGRCPTPRQVYDYVADPGRLAALGELLPLGAPARVDLDRVLALATAKTDPLGQIFNKLGPLARAEIADRLVSGPPGLSLPALVNTPRTRVLWAINVGRYRRLAPIVGRLVVALWTYAIIDVDVRKDYLKLLMADEAGVFAAGCPDLAQGLVMGRAHNAGYVLAVQHLAQLGALRGAIWDACGTKIMMGAAPYDSAEAFSRELGEQELGFRGQHTSTSLGRSGGTSAGGGLPGPGGAGGHTSRGRNSGTSAGSSEAVRLRRLWLPAEIQNLPPYHAVVTTTRATSPDAVAGGEPGTGRDVALIRIDNRDAVLVAQRAAQAEVVRRIEARCGGRPMVDRLCPSDLAVGNTLISVDVRQAEPPETAGDSVPTQEAPPAAEVAPDRPALAAPRRQGATRDQATPGERDVVPRGGPRPPAVGPVAHPAAETVLSAAPPRLGEETPSRPAEAGVARPKRRRRITELITGQPGEPVGGAGR